MFPNKILAFLLQYFQFNPKKKLEFIQKKHIILFYNFSFDILISLLKICILTYPNSTYR